MEIAFNSYSLRKEWGALTEGKGYEPVAHFIKMMEGVKEIELLDRSFNSDPMELQKAMSTFTEHDLNIFSLGPHPHPLTGKSKRPAALDELKKWTNICADHDIHNFRLSLGGGRGYDKKYLIVPIKPSSVDEAVEWTAEVLEPALVYAEEKGVNLCIETHHKYSSDPIYQEKLLDRLPFENLGFIYDFGNYENDELRWTSLDLLLKRKKIKYMHAKMYGFDEQGFEPKLDYPKAIKKMHDAGLDVKLSIEWEGSLPGPVGVLRSYELLRYSLAQVKGQSYHMKTDFPSADEIIAQVRAR